MRNLDDHIVSGDQAVQLKIEVVDEPGAGGANHQYRISGHDLKKHPAYSNVSDEDIPTWETLCFQQGPIKEAGVNGVTQEVLLAIVIDRLRAFQASQFSCRENAIALTKCEEALMWLQRRTVARIKRGVEGTHQK
jgi:hypothetical protein